MKIRFGCGEIFWPGLIGAVCSVSLLSQAIAEQAPAGGTTECATTTSTGIIVRLMSGRAFELFPKAYDASWKAEGSPAASDVLSDCPDTPPYLVSITLPRREGIMTDAAVNRGFDFGDLSYLNIGGLDVSELPSYQTVRFREVKQAYDNCRVPAGGVMLCYFCAEDPARPGHCVNKKHSGSSSDGRRIEDAGFILLDETVQNGSQNLPWVASCQAAGRNGHRYCTTVYPFAEGINVSYRFGEINAAQLDRLPEIDAEIRRLVLALRAPDHDGASYE